MMKPFTESVGGFHGRGYRERGNINIPLELAIENGIGRFSLTIAGSNRGEQGP